MGVWVQAGQGGCPEAAIASNNETNVNVVWGMSGCGS